MKYRLFVYGTLLLPRLQQRFFHRHLNTEPAVLVGWQCRMGTDGYRFIRPHAHAKVTGAILTLSQAELTRVDKWEDVPYYHREKVVLRGKGNRLTQAWVYTRRRGKGRYVPAGVFTLKSTQELQVSVQAFMRRQKKSRSG